LGGQAGVARRPLGPAGVVDLPVYLESTWEVFMFMHRFRETAAEEGLERDPTSFGGRDFAIATWLSDDFSRDEIHALRDLFRVSPHRVGVRARLGILSFERGRLDEAEFHLRWVCERDPMHREAHLYRGEALQLLGRAEDALPVLERARELDPGNARAHYLLGLVYDRRQCSLEAEENYRRARELWNS
jgi:Flp pilus assembly protein TadD